MATADQPNLEVRAPRWMKIFLIASLTANLLIVGMIGATAWRFRHGGPIAALQTQAGAGNIIGFAAGLPPERRQAIWLQTAAERRALRELRSDVRSARKDIQTSLLASPFDAAQFEVAQKRLHDAESRVRSEAQRLVLAVVKLLSADERKAFARWQDAPSGHHGRGQRGFWRRPPSESREDDRPPDPPAPPR